MQTGFIFSLQFLQGRGRRVGDTGAKNLFESVQQYRSNRVGKKRRIENRMRMLVGLARRTYSSTPDAYCGHLVARNLGAGKH
jgi:hypothetical protein